jgi:sodium/potassium/calcium exchanger 6
MVWIGAIADEVVAILSTFGEIFGLSDAIIGLTIFAIGNSLADLVANVTIAQFSPNMAYAACFGGPMLNLLLGVGAGGSYSILWARSHKPVVLDFSPTLWVSAVGLVLVLATTAVVVPLNAYRIDRRWALCLLVAYATLMTVNVVVEIRSERRGGKGDV